MDSPPVPLVIVPKANFTNRATFTFSHTEMCNGLCSVLVLCGVAGACLYLLHSTNSVRVPLCTLTGKCLSKDTTAAFVHWSENLYCSGAMEQRCRLNDGYAVSPGVCYWQKQHKIHRSWLPVESADIKSSTRATLKGHRWDPLQPHWPWKGNSAFRYFGRVAASRCLRGKHVILAGDSTTRDTFYELVTVPPPTSTLVLILYIITLESRHPLVGRWPDTAATLCATYGMIAGSTGPTVPTRQRIPVGQQPTVRAGAEATNANLAFATCE